MGQAKKTIYWLTGAAFLCVCGSVCDAQAAAKTASGSNSLLPSIDISRFVSQYGVPIIVGDKPIPAVSDDSANLPKRLEVLTTLTSGVGASWRKIYRVTPASANAPVTTLAEAQNMVDNESQVDSSVISAPTESVDKLIARSDDAYISFPDGAPTSNVSFDLSDATTAEAIATLAAQTHTHWQAAYYVAPVEESPGLEIKRIASNNLPIVPRSYQEYEEYFLNNGPFTIHTAPPPPEQTQTEATFGGTDQANQPAPLTMPAQNAAANPQQGANQQEMTPAFVRDPYGYNGLMYSPGYTFSGGSTVINPFSNP